MRLEQAEAVFDHPGKLTHEWRQKFAELEEHGKTAEEVCCCCDGCRMAPACHALMTCCSKLTLAQPEVPLSAAFACCRERKPAGRE